MRGAFENPKRESAEELLIKSARIRDQKVWIIPPMAKRNQDFIKLDVIKAAFIGDGMSEQQVADQFNLPIETVNAIVAEGKFVELRSAHVKHGLIKMQNKQVKHAQDLLELENQFKKMKIQQLKVAMQDCMAYLSLHGDFYRRDNAGEILTDLNGIPRQIPLPDAAKEIKELKSALVMGEGLKKIMAEIQHVLDGDAVTGEELNLESMFLESE